MNGGIRSRRRVGVLAAYLVLALPLGAATIISTISGIPGANGITILGTTVSGNPPVPSVRAAETSWIQNSTFQNVNIAALLDLTFVIPFPGTAYLMTRIGPGTTNASELANAPFLITGPPGPTLVTLFTGLTLGPGTYYLVLGVPTSVFGGWDLAPSGTVPITAPGVMANGNLSGARAAYAPATNFIDGFTDLDQYIVTGNAVPEPSTLVLIPSAVVALVVAGRRRRKTTNSCPK